MPHFFIPPGNITGEQFRLTGPEVRHLVRVRRCKPGTLINLFDGTGRTYAARIDATDKDEIRGTIVKREEARPMKTKLHLYQAVPKGDRFDWLVEKAAELGVRSVTPIVTERSVMKSIPEAKVHRWRRLAEAACQQCARADLMKVENPLLFRQAVDGLSSEALNIIPWEGEETRPVQEAFAARPSVPEAGIIIGPEGGFTVEEVETAQRRGVIPVTLGPRILRTETAGLISIILVLHLAGEYGAISS